MDYFVYFEAAAVKNKPSSNMPLSFSLSPLLLPLPHPHLSVSVIRLLWPSDLNLYMDGLYGTWTQLWLFITSLPLSSPPLLCSKDVGSHTFKLTFRPNVSCFLKKNRKQGFCPVSNGVHGQFSLTGLNSKLVGWLDLLLEMGRYYCFLSCFKQYVCFT